MEGGDVGIGYGDVLYAVKVERAGDVLAAGNDHGLTARLASRVDGALDGFGTLGACNSAEIPDVEGFYAVCTPYRP